MEQIEVIFNNYTHNSVNGGIYTYNSKKILNIPPVPIFPNINRYFDATKQAEFLFECVEDTVKNIIPKEVKYLINYDSFKQYLDNEFEMPDKTGALLVRFLEQSDGKFSSRAKGKEFAKLTEDEVTEIENTYKEIFN